MPDSRPLPVVLAMLTRLLSWLRPAPAWADTWPLFPRKHQPMRTGRDGRLIPWADTRPMPTRNQLAAEVHRWPLRTVATDKPNR